MGRINCVTDPVFGSHNTNTWRSDGSFVLPTPTEAGPTGVAAKWVLSSYATGQYFAGTSSKVEGTKKPWRIESGKKYTLKLWIKNTTGQAVRIFSRMAEEGGGVTYEKAQDIASGFEGWITAFEGKEAPTKSVLVRIDFRNESGASMTGTLYLGPHILEQRETAISESEVFPTVAQLESGAAVWLGATNESATELVEKARRRCTPVT